MMFPTTIRLDPAFHGQMLATWHSFGDGRYYPALLGGLGDMKLVYVVVEQGVCSGFATWREARDVAASAQQTGDSRLCRVEAPDERAQRARVASHWRAVTRGAQAGVAGAGWLIKHPGSLRHGWSVDQGGCRTNRNK